ncbi:MAG: c-type cytochrome, partial [Candidatus Omnitrophica bacterium]|nr:c-type cytochrome [Candidatus Omnitrophota bacterium]
TATPASAAVTGGSSKGYLVFSKACVACHTVGQGDRVGPDLQGVTSRREREWLKSFIQFPSKKIQDKDPIVMELMRKYPTPMVDMGLTDEQVEDVIRYLENPADISIASSPADLQKLSDQGGGAQKVATQAEISKGAALFQGKQRFLNQGASCIACHNVRNSTIFGGGALAKELTDVHSRLGSVAIPAILKNPPFPVMQAAYKDKPLMEDEISAVTAFLGKTAAEQGNQIAENYQVKMLLTGGAGLAGLLGFYCIFWLNRKRRSVNKSIYDRQKKSEKEF